MQWKGETVKFLLAAINAKFIHSNPAIYSLRAYAGEELQQYIELAEYTINQPVPEILADLYRRDPDVIGFSCYIWNWRCVQELLRASQAAARHECLAGRSRGFLLSRKHCGGISLCQGYNGGGRGDCLPETDGILHLSGNGAVLPERCAGSVS